MAEPHRWKFFRAGGFNQALLENGEDLLHLPVLALVTGGFFIPCGLSGRRI